MSAMQIRLEVRDHEPARGHRFIWVLQTTSPVRDEFSCLPKTFLTRAAAVKDFREVAGRMGWKLDPEMEEIDGEDR